MSLCSIITFKNKIFGEENITHEILGFPAACPHSTLQTLLQAFYLSTHNNGKFSSICTLVYADFKHALVLEPQNKAANLAEKRLRKLIG